jgi:hypothetical protein
MPDRHQISAVISDDLYKKVKKSRYGLTEAVNLGLDMLLNSTVNANVPQEEIKHNSELAASFQAIIESLEEQLKVKDTGYQSIIETLEEQLKAKDNGFRERIEDMKEQLRVKDQQLSTKDSQLESKDSQLEKQAVHIQTLISQKAIEAPGAKKPWWQFW